MAFLNDYKNVDNLLAKRFQIVYNKDIRKLTHKKYETYSTKERNKTANDYCSHH